MIKKKSNAYELIAKNIAKLTLIQQATGISPTNLVNIFLKTHQDSDIKISSSAEYGYREDFWEFGKTSESFYKYFRAESRKYLDKARGTSSYEAILERIQNRYLTRDYFGMEYEELELTYRSQELFLKNFVREAFIAVYPITPQMSPTERAVRNQKLGKISVSHWIGDIVNYAYFQQAPSFMMQNVKTAISRVEFYVLNVLHEKELDHDLDKLATNQNLETRLKPKDTINNKINKI